MSVFPIHGFPALPLADVLFSFNQSNFAGKAIVIVLVIGSVFSWTIMLTKMRELARARKLSQQFVAAYRAEAVPVALYLKRQRYEDSPVCAIYERTCAALGAEVEARGVNPSDLFMGGIGAPNIKLTFLQMRGIRNVADRTTADEAFFLENNMGWLATAVTAAPFLGLLGTVWGVMDSFCSVVRSGAAAAMLASVAPGISGALLTTVVGLLVALPSSIGYNMLAEKIRRLTVQMGNFVEELMADLEQHYVEAG
jgi:biopolymer transport protein ExbB/TolQ